MPVRNINSIGPSGNVKPIPSYYLIPPIFDPIYKVELIDSSNNAYNVTDLIEEGTYSDGVTDNIGAFNFKIVDPEQTYSNSINSFNYIKIYLDYGTSATTLRFKGVIETAQREEFIFFRVTGRSEGGVITYGKNIIYSATATSRSDVLKAILTAYFPTINQDNIEEDSTEITVNYSEVQFQEIIEELCGSHHDFYIDANLNARYFTKGSINNSTEIVSQDVNLITDAGYGEDSEETYTRVRVYGRKQGDIALFATSNSSTSNTNGISKEKKITDNSITTTQQATELANSQYAYSNSITNNGQITSILLPSIAPGEKLFISNPENNISPGYYSISSFTHKFPDLETSFSIEKRRMDVSRVVKSNISNISGVEESDNPNNMDFSNIITFDEDSGTHTNTAINEGYLKVEAGQGTGSWTSDLIELDDDVSEIEFRFTGDYLVQDYLSTSSYIWFSLDGGTTWRVYGFGTTEVPTGRDLKIRIDLNSSDARVKAVAVFYKY